MKFLDLAKVTIRSGSGCNGCALCFYSCPEPAALEVYKLEG